MNKKTKRFNKICLLLILIFFIISIICPITVSAQQIKIKIHELPIAGMSKILDDYYNYLTKIQKNAENLYTENELSILFRIVEAECTDGDIDSKVNVADVIINRVKNDSFPDTIEEVVFQKYQFSPISDGRYYKVEITTDTKIACYEAIFNENENAYGALYFCNLNGVTNSSFKNWFNSLTYLFTDSINHSFYK